MNLTIAYMTARKEPKIEWFIHSLRREVAGKWDGIQVVIVDFWNQPMVADGWGAAELEKRGADFRDLFCSAGLGDAGLQWCAPCGNVWQGPHRLTKENFFDASNARNTAIMVAKYDWILFVDDLSVMMPGYLAAVRAAMAGNYVMCGAYRKVKNLTVEDGIVKSFDDYAPGWDHRWRYGVDGEAIPCGGGWMYGCSVAAPIEAFLAINGYPLNCGSLGYEDSVTGQVIERNGYPFRYDRRALTLESEEHHHIGKQMRREDPGVSPNDKSHAMLAMYRSAANFGDNYYAAGGIREIRKQVLAGAPLPIIRSPFHEWFTGRPLADL